MTSNSVTRLCFNTQPPEGGWRIALGIGYLIFVSTHSRPKAAGWATASRLRSSSMFQHTAARRRLALYCRAVAGINWFQHTAARRRLGLSATWRGRRARFNTQPPEGGWFLRADFRIAQYSFQHTAARRRLAATSGRTAQRRCFNTQPPEGGWALRPCVSIWAGFNTQPPEGGWTSDHPCGIPFNVSTHSRPKAAGPPIRHARQT